ncbi:phosphotransferase [Streptomyces sp. NBC_00237]|uniref:phosphotransferase family protein n=1 Tax=Streptomyces sp. NBC_00237 TaxID=2975687 RepID=UPI00224DF948|nr:phosphotransferase [Streptomyces sp. NBC_00237]MCX5206520.1 phosphotransferase [Streptomyces sp. NBC_00237]
MNIGELLGSGRSAEVFALDDAWVLRRNRRGGDVGKEVAVMAHLAAHGFPVPTVRATEVPSEMVMQRLYGKTMLQAFASGEITELEGATILADLLHRLHEVPAREANHPEDRILHLDLHPDNVMLTADGPMVIDWCTTVEGPEGLDWAMSALILAEVAVAPAPPEAGPEASAATIGARTMLAHLLARRGSAIDLGDARSGCLVRARTRRAADPNLTPQEMERLDEAVALVATLATSASVRTPPSAAVR